MYGNHLAQVAFGLALTILFSIEFYDEYCDKALKEAQGSCLAPQLPPDYRPYMISGVGKTAVTAMGALKM